MSGVNKAIVLGRLGQDPDLNNLPSGGEVCNLSIATSERWKDKQTGEQREKTEWHRVTLFNRLAEIASQYLRKGSQVYIEGKLQTRKWQDKSGNDRWTTEIIAQNMTLLGSKNESSAPPQAPSGTTQREPGSDDDFDDDIPF